MTVMRDCDCVITELSMTVTRDSMCQCNARLYVPV